MGNWKAIVLDGFTQFKANWKLLLWLYLPILLLFIALILASRSSDDLPLSYLTRDVTAVGEVPFYAGLLSQLGAVLWSATLAICIFTVALLRDRNQNRTARRFLTQAAALTMLLLLDDIFLVHEDIGPDYLNISEKVIVIAYFFFCLAFLIWNLPEILTSEYSIVGLALLIFGTSIFVDAAHLDKYEEYGLFFSEQSQIFLEDGLKFTGIATWLTYFAKYAILKLRMQA